MPDRRPIRYQHSHANEDNGNKYGRLSAEARLIADLLHPRDNAVQEAEGDDVLGPCFRISTRPLEL